MKHMEKEQSTKDIKPTTTRLEKCFARLAEEQKKAFVTFVVAGDPDAKTSQKILEGLAQHADIIELGMPFSDPIADGPVIQKAAQRALSNGMTLKKTLDMVRQFRQANQTTPIVLMGYYNPIYIYGVEQFLTDAVSAGVDGLIVVDLPPEEDAELCLPAQQAGLNFIHLTTPTTNDSRLPTVLANASGFVYYVSITGITGAKAPEQQAVKQAMTRIKKHTSLPVCIGFGIKTPTDAQNFAALSDGVIVGSALVGEIQTNLNPQGKANAEMITHVLKLAESLAQGVKQA